MYGSTKFQRGYFDRCKPECIIFDIRIHLDLIGGIAHTDWIQSNWAVTSIQARDCLTPLLLYNTKVPLNLAIKSSQYAFSKKQLQLVPSYSLARSARRAQALMSLDTADVGCTLDLHFLALYLSDCPFSFYDGINDFLMCRYWYSINNNTFWFSFSFYIVGINKEIYIILRNLLNDVMHVMVVQHSLSGQTKNTIRRIHL